MTARRAHGRGYGKGQQRREDILRAALSVFDTRGLDEVSLRDLADAAGVPKSVVLYYFQSRDGLIEALLDSVLTPLMAAQRDAATGAGDPREQLSLWLAPCFNAMAGLAPIRLRVGVSASGSLPTARDKLAEHEDEAAQVLSALLERGHREFCWHAPDARRSTRSVMAVVDGLQVACLREGPEVDLDRARSVCRGALLDLLVR